MEWLDIVWKKMAPFKHNKTDALLGRFYTIGEQCIFVFPWCIMCLTFLSTYGCLYRYFHFESHLWIIFWEVSALWYFYVFWPKLLKKTHQISNIRYSLVDNKTVDHSDVVGASPVGVAPTTSSFSTDGKLLLLELGAVITRSNITWHCIQYCSDWGRV